MDETQTHLYAAYKKLNSDLKTWRLRERDRKTIYHANGSEKKPGIAILRQNRKTVTRDKEGRYLVIKGTIQHEDIIINIYATNMGEPK